MHRLISPAHSKTILVAYSRQYSPPFMEVVERKYKMNYFVPVLDISIYNVKIVSYATDAVEVMIIQNVRIKLIRNVRTVGKGIVLLISNARAF